MFTMPPKGVVSQALQYPVPKLLLSIFNVGNGFHYCVFISFLFTCILRALIT
jgi:DsbC/DsbD-like thiol-disulfide interchange protein